MRVVEDLASVRSLARGVVGLVPTMGFLHEGHLSMIEAAAADTDTVVVSVFVNPLQFGEPSDLSSYPRDLDRDVALAQSAGADVVVAPGLEEMFPVSPETVVSVGSVAAAMEGLHRPGHFDGVATIVAKLFAGVGPDRAYFGRKDAQQLAVVRTMVRDLSFPIDVVGRPIVREHDGLALSSRNVRLSDADRRKAVTLSQGLMTGADLFESGDASVDEIIGAVRRRVSADVSVEYVEIAGSETAAPASDLGGEQFLAIAGRIGDVRLIDNVTLDNGTRTVDRGTRLDGPSILYEGGS
jgi:pantoate--beta-alanine ligase